MVLSEIPDRLVAETLSKIRETMAATARGMIGWPYFWGSDGEEDPGSDLQRETDCSGLIFRVGNAAAIYGFPRLNAHAISLSFVPVAWEKRDVGDVVCYGDAPGACHHVMLVLDADHLIGAVHGREPLEGESDEAYRAAMAEKNAGVQIMPSAYWESKRIGVVRFPMIVALEGRVIRRPVRPDAVASELLPPPDVSKKDRDS